MNCECIVFWVGGEAEEEGGTHNITHIIIYTTCNTRIHGLFWKKCPNIYYLYLLFIIPPCLILEYDIICSQKFPTMLILVIFDGGDSLKVGVLIFK